MRLSRFSIRTRIYGGMGLLVLLGLVLTGRGIWDLMAIDRQVARMSALSDNNVRALKIARLMETMREVSLRLKHSTAQASLDPEDAAQSQTMMEMLRNANSTSVSDGQRQAFRSMMAGCTDCHNLGANLELLGKQVEGNRGRLFDGGNRLTEDAANLVAVARHAGTPEVAAAAEDLQAALLLAQLSNWRFQTTRDAEGVATFKRNASAAMAGLAALEQQDLPEEVRRAAAPLRSSLAAYFGGFATASSAMLKSDALFDSRMLPLVRQQMAAAMDVAASFGQDFVHTKEATGGMIAGTAFLQKLAAGGGLLLGGLVAWIIGRSIIRPVSGMTDAMARLAAGEMDVDIPGRDAGNEIGAMAKAVEVFRRNAVDRARLEAERYAQAAQAAREKHTALTDMAEKIETESTDALDPISKRTAAMVTTAEQMNASAGRTGVSAESAASAATEALASTQTIASATEQLAASIRSIGSQVSQSTAVVGRAVAAGKETRATMEALNEQIAQICSVADMINEIAGRTNLLALNATIEAARAGDAGKGFAVVAGEVKQLANQTAKFTREIGSHIAEVRAATGASVAAVNLIEETIEEINDIAGSIATAVQEQGQATAEIARNVSETVTAANEMAQRIHEVSTEAEQTGRDTLQMRQDTVALNAALGQLRRTVVRIVRTTTADVDRRHGPRVAVDRECRLVVPGHGTHRARVLDLSQGGAAVAGAPALPDGTRGTLEVGGVDEGLPFVVRASDGDVLHLAFDPGSDNAAAVEHALGYALQQAA